ncbi:MAG: glycosyltransferase family 39 protein [Candidatus Saccharimonadales bacterium]
MNAAVIREILLYRYRYVAGIFVFIVVLIGLLVVRTDLAPTGLTDLDMQSALRSATFKFSQPLAQSTVDLPYLLVQKASLHFLGITEFAIKLPSIVFGVATGFAFIMMVRRWFRLNIALVTSLILVSSAAFLTLARSGHGDVMTSFWLSLFLLAATNIVHPEGKTKLWFLIALLLLPFSLYTPLMMYPIIAIAIAGILHPHVRFTLKHVTHWQYAVGLAFFVVALAPLILTITLHPSSGLELLGIPTHHVTGSELVTNAKSVVKSFFNLGNAIVGIVPQPVFGAASFIIIVLGFLRTAKDWYSARSYMLLIWSAMFIPLAVLNPDKLLICLVPAYLFLAIGVETIIREWYRLFPFNPYARLAAVVPLVALLGGIMASNAAQYFYGHFYGTPTVTYHQQLTATRAILDRPQYKNAVMTVIAKPDEQSFYDLLRRDYPRTNVATTQDTAVARPTIVHDGVTVVAAIGLPKEILTSYKTKQDRVIVRFYAP